MNEPTLSAFKPAHRALVVLAGLAAFAAVPARAQYLQTYFPGSVPGYDQQLGVTVLSRLRPEYDQPGVRIGSFVVRPQLNEQVGFDSNPVGLPNGPGSWLLTTSPSVAINSDWSNARFGASLSATNYRYFDTTNQDRTDWTAALGGGVTVRQHDSVSVAYSHLALHENAYDVGGVASTLPTPFRVDDVRAAYGADFGRVTLTPNLEFQRYSFDPTQVGGTPVSQAYRNRNVLLLALTGRYGLTSETGLLVVVAGTGSNYTEPAIGAPSNNSRSALVLVGLDNLLGELVRYRLLVGGEVRTFAASAYPTHSAPVAEASVIWTPTGLTTVTGTAAHTIEDPSSEGTAGFEFTNASLVVDHEYQRNILLQGRGLVQHATFLQSTGSQTALGIGAGITYLVNRNIRVGLNYDYVHQSGTNPGNYTVPVTTSLGGIAAGTTTTAPVGIVSFGSFQRHLILLSLTFGI